jgi:hypothetical protein
LCIVHLSNHPPYPESTIMLAMDEVERCLLRAHTVVTEVYTASPAMIAP